ncbi:MAG: hypothetical protein ACYTDT_01070 [Planctomycetota bacterium]|jgi:hypothetical protein
MSGNGQTTVSGVRVASFSRQEEPVSTGGRRLEFVAHFFLVLLALAIWWIARDMVSVERQLQSAAQVQVKLDPKLENVWQIVGEDSFRISLKVDGPNREINQFESSIEQNPAYHSYGYDIEPGDLTGVGDTEERVTIKLDLRHMNLSGDGSGHSELKVQPIISEGEYTVTLERFVTRKAHVDLTAGISGEIGGFAFDPVLERDFEVEVFGPASRVNAVVGGRGLPVLLVNADINQVLQTIARLEDKTIDEILQLGQILTSLPLTPIEGLTARKAGGKDEIAQVNVQISFTELQNYVPASHSFPVDVKMPNWLIRKGARILELPETIPVGLLVLSTQKIDFNEKYVKVVIDLSGITEDSVQINGPEGGGPGRRTVRVSNLYYQLEMDTSRLTYKFENPELTADRYLPTEVEIVWSE